MGMLSAEPGVDLMDPASWHKHPEPVFTAVGSGAEGTHAAGHNSFFSSHDEARHFILYHANDTVGKGWSNRSPGLRRLRGTQRASRCLVRRSR